MGYFGQFPKLGVLWYFFYIYFIHGFLLFGVMVSDARPRGDSKMHMEKAARTFSGSWAAFKAGETIFYLVSGHASCLVLNVYFMKIHNLFFL